MIFRLRHLTPGYFRLLQGCHKGVWPAIKWLCRRLSLSENIQRFQMQLASGSKSESQDRLVNHLALLLAIMGLSLSYYSARQMSEEVKPPAEP